MTEHESRPAEDRGTATATTTTEVDDRKPSPLEGNRNRHEASLRLPPLADGQRDPDSSHGTRYHRPTVGLHARGFREGYRAGGLYTLRRLWSVLPESARGLARKIANELEGGDG